MGKFQRESHTTILPYVKYSLLSIDTFSINPSATFIVSVECCFFIVSVECGFFIVSVACVNLLLVSVLFLYC